MLTKHPLIVSVNGVGEEIKVRLDCGQHRARVVLAIAGIAWLPYFMEPSELFKEYVVS